MTRLARAATHQHTRPAASVFSRRRKVCQEPSIVRQRGWGCDVLGCTLRTAGTYGEILGDHRFVRTLKGPLGAHEGDPP
jgi:hypothetical protein